ncbi:hypothetical protein IAQ61_008158 [Plenodomus lingam]|uniref:uncharacterized protein n=1 Tax=Leptosphaeria maculans TaxID=5022 RepID=UPI00332CB98F|nr:hypothetical protein IAQ61_008158 [Plenodomus lingam]
MLVKSYYYSVPHLQRRPSHRALSLAAPVRQTRTPVTDGPLLWDKVLRMLTTPMTAVRSSGKTTMERNADRGAWSIELSTERPTKRQIVSARPDGAGRSARKIDAGRWVKTIAWMRPRRLAKEEANMLPAVEAN